MNNETEQIFIVNTSNTQPLVGEQKINEASMSTADVEDFSTVCRTCATVTEFVIPIFDGEGLQNNLADKIHKHLPIQVSEQDLLPRVVCYQCASTLLAWHELVQCCLQADGALRARLARAPAPPPATQHFDTTKSKTIDKDTSQSSAQDQPQKGGDPPGAAGVESADRGAPAAASPREDAKPPVILLGEDGRRYSRCEICQRTVPASSRRRHARTHRGERRHGCPVCGLVFGDAGNLARHARAVHAGRRPHECAVCRKSFSRRSHLQDHVRSHSESRDFVCDVCGKASKSSAALRMHRATHDARRFRCVECGAMFKRRGELRAHASVHTGERAHACGCGRRFRLRAQLTRHARTHEPAALAAACAIPATSERVGNIGRGPSPPRYPAGAGRACAYCAARVSESSYEEHLVDLHSDRLFHCNECDTYVDRKEFILHMSTHAAEYAVKPEKEDSVAAAEAPSKEIDRRDENENDEGGRRPGGAAGGADRPRVDVGTDPAPRFDEKNEFSDHSDAENAFEPLPESVFEAIEDSRDGRPPESSAPARPRAGAGAAPVKTCPVCGREFAARSSYFYHMKIFHGKSREHECATCGKRFGTRAMLAEHEHVHSGARPHACERCGKRFGSRSCLYIHAQTHGGAARWACAQCGRAFRWRAQLARHGARHAARREHACGRCARRFNIRADLLRHARTHDRQDHVCERCGAHFAQLRYLKVHARKKHAADGDTGAAK